VDFTHTPPATANLQHNATIQLNQRSQNRCKVRMRIKNWVNAARGRNINPVSNFKIASSFAVKAPSIIKDRIDQHPRHPRKEKRQDHDAPCKDEFFFDGFRPRKTGHHSPEMVTPERNIILIGGRYINRRVETAVGSLPVAITLSGCEGQSIEGWGRCANTYHGDWSDVPLSKSGIVQ